VFERDPRVLVRDLVRAQARRPSVRAWLASARAGPASARAGLASVRARL